MTENKINQATFTLNSCYVLVKGLNKNGKYWLALVDNEQYKILTFDQEIIKFVCRIKYYNELVQIAINYETLKNERGELNIKA